MEFVSLKWVAILGVATLCTIAFSMSNTPGVRGWRYFGWLGCYVIGIIMLFVLPSRISIGTWLIFGVLSGILYFMYEIVGYVRNRTAENRPRIATLVNGLYLWPIMLPEVVEYSLSDLGILKTEAGREGG